MSQPMVLHVAAEAADDDVASQLTQMLGLLLMLLALPLTLPFTVPLALLGAWG